MKQFIITSKEKEVKDYKGGSLGMQNKRALFFYQKIGRRRIYRASFYNPQNGLKLLVYKTMRTAELVCELINKTYNDTFEVEVKS